MVSPRSMIPLGIVALASTAHAASDCAGLATVKPEATTITSATVVAAPAIMGGSRVTVLFCRVEGVARPSQHIPVAGQPPVLTDAKRAQVTQRVVAACDGIDGLVDGQITNPRACKFDVDTLGPSGDKTLTAQELAVVKAMYSGTVGETGVRRSPGAKLGSEADWTPLFADNGGYGAFLIQSSLRQRDLKLPNR